MSTVVTLDLTTSRDKDCDDIAHKVFVKYDPADPVHQKIAFDMFKRQLAVEIQRNFRNATQKRTKTVNGRVEVTRPATPLAECEKMLRALESQEIDLTEVSGLWSTNRRTNVVVRELTFQEMVEKLATASEEEKAALKAALGL